MHPKAIVTVNGTPVAGLFWERLVKLTVTDNEGSKTDTIDLDLEDGAPHIQLPKHGDSIECLLGYEETGVEHMGTFKVTDVDVDCLPYHLKIKGESADMRETMKEHRDKHYDDKSYGDIFQEIAGRHGLSAQVDPEIAAVTEPWIGQEGESDMSFAESLARKADGICSVKDGRLIVAKKGTGTTAGGAAMPPVVLSPQLIVKKTCTVSFGKREKHKSAKASYHDKDKGTRQTEKADADSSGSAVYHLRKPYGSKAEAKRAAKSKAKYLKGDGIRTSVTIEGDPFAKAGCPLIYVGVRPEVDGLQFVIERAVHTFAKSGFKTALSAKIKDGESDPSEG